LKVMSLVVLNKMLKKIRSLVSNFEKVFKKKEYREVTQSQGAPREGRSKESVAGIHARSTQTKIPDPWFN